MSRIPAVTNLESAACAAAAGLHPLPLRKWLHTSASSLPLCDRWMCVRSADPANCPLAPCHQAWLAGWLAG